MAKVTFIHCELCTLLLRNFTLTEQRLAVTHTAAFNNLVELCGCEFSLFLSLFHLKKPRAGSSSYTTMAFPEANAAAETLLPPAVPAHFVILVAGDCRILSN